MPRSDDVHARSCGHAVMRQWTVLQVVFAYRTPPKAKNRAQLTRAKNTSSSDRGANGPETDQQQRDSANAGRAPPGRPVPSPAAALFDLQHHARHYAIVNVAREHRHTHFERSLSPWAAESSLRRRWRCAARDVVDEPRARSPSLRLPAPGHPGRQCRRCRRQWQQRVCR